MLSVLFEISCVVYCTNPAEATRSSTYRAALAGAYKFPLWHGIGLKQLDLQNTATANLLNTQYLGQLSGAVDLDEILSPSSLYDDQWREAFGVERVLRAGFPRNEVLVRPASELELLDASVIFPVISREGFHPVCADVHLRRSDSALVGSPHTRGAGGIRPASRPGIGHQTAPFRSSTRRRRSDAPASLGSRRRSCAGRRSPVSIAIGRCAT